MAIFAIIVTTVVMCVKSYRRKSRLRHAGAGQCMYEYFYSTLVQQLYILSHESGKLTVPSRGVATCTRP